MKLILNTGELKPKADSVKKNCKIDKNSYNESYEFMLKKFDMAMNKSIKLWKKGKILSESVKVVVIKE